MSRGVEGGNAPDPVIVMLLRGTISVSCTSIDCIHEQRVSERAWFMEWRGENSVDFFT